MCKYTQCPIDPLTAARVCIVYIYVYVLATNSKTKVPLILPIVKEPSITRGNEIFNIHLVALLIYDPDLQVHCIHFTRLQKSISKNRWLIKFYYQSLWTSWHKIKLVNKLHITHIAKKLQHYNKNKQRSYTCLENVRKFSAVWAEFIKRSSTEISILFFYMNNGSLPKLE